MSLALATLIYEWRRYMAAVVALAFSGMMVLAFSGLFGGIIHSVFATTERSRADLFILPPKVESLVRSNVSLPARIEPLIYLNPEVLEVKSFEGSFAMWTNVAKQPGQKQVQKPVQFFGIDPIPGAVTLPADYSDQTRIALMEPGAVAADASALAQLGVGLGDKATVNGKSVWVRSILHNYQDVDEIDVIASRDTLRMLGLYEKNGRTGPLMVRIRDPKRAVIVRDQLNAISHGAYRAWTREEFNLANERAVMSEQIVGVLLTFSVFLAILIGIGITSQTLRGAILSNIREFASLRALGISMGSLRLIVMELSFWVGVAGLIAACVLTFLIGLAAGAVGLPIIYRMPTFIWVFGMLMLIAMVSGAMAMGILKKSQPADLLR
jgi:putative ABC transport system permease protein